MAFPSRCLPLEKIHEWLPARCSWLHNCVCLKPKMLFWWGLTCIPIWKDQSKFKIVIINANWKTKSTNKVYRIGEKSFSHQGSCLQKPSSSSSSSLIKDNIVFKQDVQNKICLTWRNGDCSGCFNDYKTSYKQPEKMLQGSVLLF